MKMPRSRLQPRERAIGGQEAGRGGHNGRDSAVNGGGAAASGGKNAPSAPLEPVKRASGGDLSLESRDDGSLENRNFSQLQPRLRPTINKQESLLGC